MSRESGVLRGGRVEQPLRVEYLFVGQGRAEHAEVDGEPMVESLLHEIKFCCKIAIFVGFHWHLMFHNAHRGTVVGLFIATCKGQMMVLNETCSGDGGGEIVVFTTVVIAQSPRSSCRNISLSVQHLEVFIHRFEADISVVRDAKLPFQPLNGRNEDDARCPSRTVLSRFRSIFQHFERQNVGRIDGRQRGNIARNAIDHHQRVVSAGERSRSAHPHTVEHGLPLVASARYVHTRKSTV